MHQEIKSLDIREVYASIFQPAKTTMRMLFKQNSLMLIVKSINSH